MGPEQRRQRSAVRIGELVGPPRIGQDLLHQQRVDVHQRGLQQVQREHADLLGLLVRTGQVAAARRRELPGPLGDQIPEEQGEHGEDRVARAFQPPVLGEALMERASIRVGRVSALMEARMASASIRAHCGNVPGAGVRPPRLGRTTRSSSTAAATRGSP